MNYINIKFLSKNRYPICISIFFFLFLFLNITGCKNKNIKSADKDNNITFDTIYTNKGYYINNDSTQPSCNLKLTFIYPKNYEKASILDSIQNIFITSFIGKTTKVNSPQEALDNYEKEYIESYKHDIDIFYSSSKHDNENKYLSYYETIVNKIIFNKQNILSFQVSRVNYKGGVNSYKFYNNYSINLKTGSLITESDLFGSDYKEALSSLFIEYLIKKNKVKDISELNNMGYFGIQEIVPNDNFIIEKEGITYTFNIGEYSTYNLDPIVITIPFKDLKNILDENSPISDLVANQDV